MILFLKRSGFVTPPLKSTTPGSMGFPSASLNECLSRNAARCLVNAGSRVLECNGRSRFSPFNRFVVDACFREEPFYEHIIKFLV